MPNSATQLFFQELDYFFKKLFGGETLIKVNFAQFIFSFYLHIDKYEVLVYAIPVETNTGFNKIDFMDAKVEEMKEKMTELITWDPTLEPDTIVDKLLNDFTDNLEGQAKRELAACSA